MRGRLWISSQSAREESRATPTRQAVRPPMSPDRVMAIYRIDPLRDSRWDDFLQEHPHASVSHNSMAAGTTCYIRVRASGFYQRGAGHGVDKRNRVLSDQELSDRFSPICALSRHCDPLVSSPSDLSNLLHTLSKLLPRKLGSTSNCAASVRLQRISSNAPPGRSFAHRVLDLRMNVEIRSVIFKGGDLLGGRTQS
jgi:hypothetical protein